MQITQGYRTELDLNNEQIIACKKHAGAARYAYNWRVQPQAGGLQGNRSVFELA
jgi:hypothetical protein